jgi:hypothetical protein
MTAVRYGEVRQDAPFIGLPDFLYQLPCRKSSLPLASSALVQKWARITLHGGPTTDLIEAVRVPISRSGELKIFQEHFNRLNVWTPNTTVVDSDNLSLLWQWFSGVRDGEANIGLEA